jgi:uncharacterized protein (TIGR04255 family)
MRLPRKISPCPIAEALVEIRFSPVIPYDAVFGVVYNAVKDKFTKFDNLPILQVPEAIRSQDVNLMYKPTHRLFDSNFILQIGPKVITLSNIKDYVGWDHFFKQIVDTFDIVINLNIVKSFETLFLRYIDIFDKNFFEISNLLITLSGEPLQSIGKKLTANIQDNNYIHKIEISDRAEIEMGDSKYEGSVVDIQSQLLVNGINFVSKYEEILNDIHIKQKTLFFKLLKDDFIATLNPEY